MAIPSLSTEGVSPAFLNALEGLIQAHCSELVKANEKAILSHSTFSVIAELAVPKPGIESIDDADEHEQNNDASQHIEIITPDARGKVNMMHGPSNEIALFGDISAGLSDGTQIDEPEYDVCSFYLDKGPFQAIARNHYFGILTLVAIVANAIYLVLSQTIQMTALRTKSGCLF
jgi:hypothetical protein